MSSTRSKRDRKQDPVAFRTRGGLSSPSQAEVERKKKDWRALWEASIDRTKWIPIGAAARIVARYPPPTDPSVIPLFGEATRNIERALKAEFAAHNLSYLAQQSDRLRSFFHTIEKNPLTDQQVAACVCMDHALQIVAAAGSGKTSTMVAKTGYALHERLAKPEQILLLAFNSDAVKELKARVQNRLKSIDGADRVTVKTFDAFGLEVIAKVSGRKPSLAPWMDRPGGDLDMITQIASELRHRDLVFGVQWDTFRALYGRDLGRLSESPDTGTAEGGRAALQTANGEVVKSKEERLIADWLFYHGVRYEYERDYEHDTATAEHRQYKPDFYYPDAQLYHEHFALDERGVPPKDFEAGYLEGVRWKRALHATHGTSLVETTSHGLRNDQALKQLGEELQRRGVELHFDPTRKSKGASPISDRQLATTIRTFQQHVKGGRLTAERLAQSASAVSGDTHVARVHRFLAIYHRISDEWERRLHESRSVDFDDMLLKAIDHIESGRFKSPFTIVLADEFQDCSRARMLLLKALMEQAGEHGHLCVVGDDWQGINRFAGADISLMTDFEKSFEHASRLQLTKTFRCPASLSDPASAFVQANPRQIKKIVETANDYGGLALVGVAFEDSVTALARLERDLARLHADVGSGTLVVGGDRAVEVLLLGRYNHDRPSNLQRWQSQFGDRLTIEFRTVHRAKGLEADYVIVLNVVEGMTGFPSQITDDPILQIAMPAPDPFPMAEERRLFYVALTRARRQTRIFTTLAAPSRFLLELARSQALEIKLDGGGTLALCPKCANGFLRRQDSKHGPFECCSNSVRCGFKRNVESSARPALRARVRLKTPMREGDNCPTCERGTLVKRSGPYNPFLGCSQYPECQTIADLRKDNAAPPA